MLFRSHTMSGDDIGLNSGREEPGEGAGKILPPLVCPFSPYCRPFLERDGGGGIVYPPRRLHSPLRSFYGACSPAQQNHRKGEPNLIPPCQVSETVKITNVWDFGRQSEKCPQAFFSLGFLTALLHAMICRALPQQHHHLAPLFSKPQMHGILTTLN